MGLSEWATHTHTHMHHINWSSRVDLKNEGEKSNLIKICDISFTDEHDPNHVFLDLKHTHTHTHILTGIHFLPV